jgi:hypothetical protein
VSHKRRRNEREDDKQCSKTVAANAILVVDASVHEFLQVPFQTQRLPWRSNHADTRYPFISRNAGISERVSSVMSASSADRFKNCITSFGNYAE